MVYIYDGEVDILMSQKSLKNLYFVVWVVIGWLVLLYFNETIEKGRSAVLIQTVDVDSIFKQFFAYFWWVVEIFGNRHQMVQGVPIIDILKVTS